MKNNLSKIFVGSVCALLGFLIVFQIRMSNASKSRSMYNSSDIESDIEVLKEKKNNLTEANAELKENVSELEAEAAEANAEGQDIKDQLYNERVNLGIIDVTGDGVTITIKAKNTMFGSTGKDTSKNIDTSDIIKILDALWFGGAEAISVNDMRITMQTGISSSASDILIGSAGKITASDAIVIKAIGDSDKMKKNISEEFSVMSNSNLIQNYNVNVESTKALVIEKTTENLQGDQLRSIHDK